VQQEGTFLGQGLLLAGPRIERLQLGHGMAQEALFPAGLLERLLGRAQGFAGLAP
jgi:hypothetical protein